MILLQDSDTFHIAEVFSVVRKILLNFVIVKLKPFAGIVVPPRETSPAAKSEGETDAFAGYFLGCQGVKNSILRISRIQ